MNRREFSRDLLLTISSYTLIETLLAKNLLAKGVKPITQKWLKELESMCKDLRINAISPLDWQRKIDEFYHHLSVEELIQQIDFQRVTQNMQYPDLGVTTRDIHFPLIEGISDKYSFTGRVFGMQKDRAILPHGHKNMVSCHRVLKGEFLLRQYDRVRDEGDYMIIRPTIEETGKTGSFSSISDQHNNVHWLVANTPTAFTFDVIVANLNEEKHTEIDNIDMYAAQRHNDLLRVKKIEVEKALKKYGKVATHH